MHTYIHFLQQCINILLYIIFIFNLASFLSISLQPSGFGQSIVGQPQDVICSIAVPSDVDPGNSELGWVNEEDIITDDGRVTIDTSPTDTSSGYFNGSTLFTSIQFDPLSEEDEGQYICYAIINGSFIFESISLQNFTSK